MSHHQQQHDEEHHQTIADGSHAINPTLRHHHSHINLKPTAVFDHIKTKVKQKRLSNHSEQDFPPHHHHHHSKRTDRTQTESDSHKALSSNRYDGSDKEESNPIFDLDEAIDQTNRVTDNDEDMILNTKKTQDKVKSSSKTDLNDQGQTKILISRNIINKTGVVSEESIAQEHQTEVSSRSHSQPVLVVSAQPKETPTDLPSSLPSTFVNEQSSIKYPLNCPCESHLARVYVDQLVSLNVDTVFELAFGENAFTRAYHDSQKLIDYTVGEWQVNLETGKRERQVTYRTITQSMLGTNTITCSEKQMIDAERPGLIAVVSSEVHNEGMKYTDAFYVMTRFCMAQRDAEHSLLRISAEIKYVKNVNGIARAFIEKNANASIESGIMNFVQRLENYQSTVSSRKPVSSKKKSERSKRKIFKEKTRDKETQMNVAVIETDQTKTRNPQDFLLVVGLILLFVHIYLCYKLYSIDGTLSKAPISCLEKCQKACFHDP